MPPIPHGHYGWKPSPPDIRDFIFAAPPHVVAALPPSVDLTQPATGEPWATAWNQQQIGSCGPHSSAADIVFAALRQQNLASVPMPSRLFIYYCARSVMGTVSQDSGVDNRSMLKALAKYGWCDESLWPYDIRQFRAQPAQAAFDQAATRKIVRYEAVPQDLATMKACLAGGDPFIFGFSVYQSFESQTTTRTGVVPLPQRGERQLGGHDVLMVGYDDSTKCFKFRNSYGPTWGQSGYGFMPYEYATNPRLSSDFWTVKHSALPDASPVPPPLPQPPTDPEISIILTGTKAVKINGKVIPL